MCKPTRQINNIKSKSLDCSNLVDLLNGFSSSGIYKICLYNFGGMILVTKVMNGFLICVRMLVGQFYTNDLHHRAETKIVMIETITVFIKENRIWRLMITPRRNTKTLLQF